MAELRQEQHEQRCALLTLSAPIPSRLYTLTYWSNPLFLIFDILALWRSRLSARAPECQKLKMMGQTSMALDPLNSRNVEQLALQGLKQSSFRIFRPFNVSKTSRSQQRVIKRTDHQFKTTQLITQRIQRVRRQFDACWHSIRGARHDIIKWDSAPWGNSSQIDCKTSFSSSMFFVQAETSYSVPT